MGRDPGLHTHTLLAYSAHKMPQRAWEFKMECPDEEQWVLMCELLCADVPRAAAYYNMGKIHGFLLDYNEYDWQSLPGSIVFTEWTEDVMELTDLYWYSTYVIKSARKIIQMAKI